MSHQMACVNSAQPLVSNNSTRNYPLRDYARCLNEQFVWTTFALVDKVPIVKWGSAQGFVDANWRRANGIGVKTGAASDWLVGRDFDIESHYWSWAEQFPTLAKLLPTVRTRRGFHVYFRTPGVEHYAKVAGVGEYIGDSGHYVVIPPSVHPKMERVYEWVIAPGDVVPVVEDPVAAGLMLTGDSSRRAAAGASSDRKKGKRAKRAVRSATSLTEAKPIVVGRLKYAPWAFIPEKVRRVVRRCTPTQEGERKDCILEMIRSLLGLDETWCLWKLQQVFSLWYGEAVKVIGTKERDVSWEDCVEAWGSVEWVKRPLDVDRLRASVQVSLVNDNDHDHDKTNNNSTNSYSDTRQECRLLTPKEREALAALEVLQHDGEVFLSGDDLGATLKVNPQRARRLRAALVEKGYLELIERGGNFKGKASTYRLVAGATTASADTQGATPPNVP